MKVHSEMLSTIRLTNMADFSKFSMKTHYNIW